MTTREEFVQEVQERAFSFIDVYETKPSKRWQWMPTELWGNQNWPSEELLNQTFTSRETAINFAFGWIRRNNPEIFEYCENETREAIKYRARKRA